MVMMMCVSIFIDNIKYKLKWFFMMNVKNFQMITIILVNDDDDDN